MRLIQHQYLLDYVLQTLVEVVFLVRPYHFEAEHLPQNLLSLFAVCRLEVALYLKIQLHYLGEVEHLERLNEVAEPLEIRCNHLNLL